MSESCVSLAEESSNDGNTRQRGLASPGPAQRPGWNDTSICGRARAEESGPAGPPPAKSDDSQIVRVEANFLRLPLFALDNKHLRSMDGIRCSGTFRRDGQSIDFTFVATRNAG